MITFILLEALTLGFALWVGYMAGKHAMLRRAQRWGREFEELGRRGDAVEQGLADLQKDKNNILEFEHDD